MKEQIIQTEAELRDALRKLQTQRINEALDVAQLLLKEVRKSSP